LQFAAFLCLFLVHAGISQPRFYENGQPTRTGPDAAIFPETSYRTKIDLSGQWNYTLDDQTWSIVAVPSAYDFSGRVTFQREFEITSDMLDKFTFSLVAYGINYQSEITINGNFIGRHSGGYSSFIFSIPQNILQVGKQNSIKVLVDNELTPKTTLPLRQQVGGWRTYGGIFRDIYILATPKLFVENIGVRTEIVNDAKGELKSAKIIVRSEITDHDAQATSGNGMLGFQVEADDKLSGEMVGRSGIIPIAPQLNKSIQSNAEVVIAGPKLWSPETPDLYVIKCQLVHVLNKDVNILDEFASDVGIRATSWKNGKLIVNGTEVSLKGVLWQEDHSTFASAMTYEALEHDVASIKALGANLIRFLYPPHPYMLNLCDRYGILAMEEIPLRGVPAEILMKDYYQDLALTYIREMVDRDKNHVCILAWGIGDEFETTPTTADYINAARNLIKSIDPRNVYFASPRIKVQNFDYVDLVALNTYGVDAKELNELLKRYKATGSDKPLIVARYGRDIEPGNRNGYSDPLSMESQARYIMQCFNVMKDSKIAGSILWSFNDWHTDRAALTAHSNDAFLATMGIVSYEREKRPAYDVARALFNDEKVQALPVGNYSSGSPIVFVIVGFIILVSFAFVYNSNRRFREAVNRSLFRTYNFFADVRDQRILTYGHSLILAAIISLTMATVMSSIFTHYRENLLLDNLLSQILSDDMKIWLIQLVWHPFKFILMIGGFFLIAFFVLSLVIQILSMMVRTRVLFYHAFSITVWSMLPYVLLIPVAMIMFRLMESDAYIMPIFFVLIIMKIWVLLRLLKGISIIYDVYPMKVYAIGALVIIVATAALYGYLDYEKSTTVYLKYMMQSIKNSV